MRPLLKSFAALAAAGAAGCVAYPAYDTAPGRVYYDTTWVGPGSAPAYCDPYYGPCTTYYRYDYYSYPPSYPTYVYIDGHRRRPPHHGDHGHRGGHWGDHDGDHRGDHRDDGHERPVTSPLVPIRPPADRKPPVVYAPKPPRTVPGDRRIPRDPGPSVQSVRSPVPMPGRVVSAKPQPQAAPPPRSARPAAAAQAERAARATRQPAPAARTDEPSEQRQRLRRQMLD